MKIYSISCNSPTGL